MENMIEIQNLSRFFPVAGGEPFYALTDVNARIPKGTLTILKGKSGSGKTTLLNILGTLDAPSAGRIIWDGRDITGISEHEKEQMRRTRIGYVFQSVSLIPMLTVYENVEFALRLANYPGERKQRVMECLDLVGLAKRAKHMPQELSGGEQQRVAIARTIAHKPQVVFADEPTAELDTASAHNVVMLFQKLVKEQGITIVMTTHDMALMGSGNLVYRLEDGIIHKEGDEENGQ